MDGHLYGMISMCVWVGEWMDGWEGGWMDGCMGGWMGILIFIFLIFTIAGVFYPLCENVQLPFPV